MGNKCLGLLSFTMILASLVLAACGGGGEANTNAADGEQLFMQVTIDTTPGCKTCHSLEPDAVIVGPSVAGIASRAGNMVPGISAEEYLRQSILEPDSYVVEGYPPSVMPNVWDEKLTEEQVKSLVDYLLTLK